jgi:hypothetical protein
VPLCVARKFLVSPQCWLSASQPFFHSKVSFLLLWSKTCDKLKITLIEFSENSFPISMTRLQDRFVGDTNSVGSAL